MGSRDKINYAVVCSGIFYSIIAVWNVHYPQLGNAKFILHNGVAQPVLMTTCIERPLYTTISFRYSSNVATLSSKFKRWS